MRKAIYGVALQWQRVGRVAHIAPINAVELLHLFGSQIVARHHIHAHVAVFLIVGFRVDGPHRHLQAIAAKGVHRFYIKVARLNARIGFECSAPSLIACPIGCAEPLALKLGIIFAHIFHRLLHTGENHHFIGETLFGDKRCKAREIAHIAVVEPRGPLELNHRERIFLNANIKVLLHGANGARVGDTTARLRIGFGLQFSQSGISHSEVAA